MQQKSLFQEFSPVSKEEWKKKIIQDLKGADYDSKMLWHNDSGFVVDPVTTKEDLKNLRLWKTLPGKFPFVRGNNKEGRKWFLNQEIDINDTTVASKEIRSALKNGINSITLTFHYEPLISDFEKLLSFVNPDNVFFNFHFPDIEKGIEIFIDFAQQQGWELEKLKGSIYFDNIGNYVETGNLQDFNVFKSFKTLIDRLSGFRFITINTSVFHNSGASTVTEMASALSMGVEYMEKLIETGFPADKAAKMIQFEIAVGSVYFMEIAKLRAFRYLWSKVLSAYKLEGNATRTIIHTVNGLWNKTVYDPYTNMLRTTTEIMAAIIGNSDFITVRPFDSYSGKSTDNSKRWARNQQIILKEESFFDKVADPASGSYFIETLTHQLIKKSWDLFLLFEDEGGFISCFEKEIIQERIETEAQQKIMDFSSGKKPILGVNKFPDIKERKENELSEDFFSLPLTNKGKVKILRPFRMAAVLERLRYKTDSYSLQNKRPLVWLFPFGEISMRSVRTQFAANFFGCAGFEIHDNSGFDNILDGINHAKKEKPDIIVLCAGNEDYKKHATDIYDSLKDVGIIVVAGDPKVIQAERFFKEISHFAHSKSNILEEIDKYQQELGII